MNEQYDEYNEVIKQLEAKCAELERRCHEAWEGNRKFVETIAVQQLQIQEYRDALQEISTYLDNHGASFEDVCLFNVETANAALAHSFDTSAFRDGSMNSPIHSPDNQQSTE